MLTTYNVLILAFFIASLLIFYTFKPLAKGFIRFKNNGETSKLTLCVLGIIGLVPVALVDLYVWFLFLLVFPIYPHYGFDKSDWAAHDAQRYKMADDLVDSQLLIGLTKNQVIELLGKPTNEYDNTIRYFIGERPTPGLDLDPDEIVLDLKDGKVVNSYLHET